MENQHFIDIIKFCKEYLLQSEEYKILRIKEIISEYAAIDDKYITKFHIIEQLVDTLIKVSNLKVDNNFQTIKDGLLTCSINNLVSSIAFTEVKYLKSRDLY